MTADESFDLHIDTRLVRRQLAVIDLALVLYLHDGMRRQGAMTALQARRWLGMPRGARTTINRILDRYCVRIAPDGVTQLQVKWSLQPLDRGEEHVEQQHEAAAGEEVHHGNLTIHHSRS